MYLAVIQRYLNTLINFDLTFKSTFKNECHTLRMEKGAIRSISA